LKSITIFISVLWHFYENIFQSCGANFVTEPIEEQRVCVKRCFKLGKSSSETSERLQQVFGDYVLSRTTCFEWFKRLKEGRTSVKDNERPGRPSTSKTNETVARVREVIRNDRRLTIREVAEDVVLAKKY